MAHLLSLAARSFPLTCHGRHRPFQTVVDLTKNWDPLPSLTLLFFSGCGWQEPAGSRFITGKPKGSNGRGAQDRERAAADDSAALGGGERKVAPHTAANGIPKPSGAGRSVLN